MQKENSKSKIKEESCNSRSAQPQRKESILYVYDIRRGREVTERTLVHAMTNTWTSVVVSNESLRLEFPILPMPFSAICTCVVRVVSAPLDQLPRLLMQGPNLV